MKLSVIGGAAFLLSGGVALAAVALLGHRLTSPVKSAAASGENPQAPAITAENAVVFSVPDMHCEFACAPAVRDALASVPGVEKVETDVVKQTATVFADGEFDEEQALSVLAAAGYPGRLKPR